MFFYRPCFTSRRVPKLARISGIHPFIVELIHQTCMMPSFDHNNNHNRPFPICLLPLCQNKSSHLYENVLPLQALFYANQTHFHMKGFAQGFILKLRDMVTRKWPIDFVFSLLFKF